MNTPLRSRSIDISNDEAGAILYKAGVQKYKAGAILYKAGALSDEAGAILYKTGVLSDKAGAILYKAGVMQQDKRNCTLQKTTLLRLSLSLLHETKTLY